jgi:hypothetical protein
LVRRQGRRDGRAGVPRADDTTPSEYEKQLLARGGQHLAQIMKIYGEKIAQIEEKREAAIERFRVLTDRYLEEMRRYDERRKQLNRDVMVHFISGRRYLLLMLVIALGEFALNAQAFEVFQKPIIATVLMAASVGIGLPWAAHACGIWLRQWKQPYWRNGLLLLLTVGAVVGALIGINETRRAYLAEAGLQFGALDQILEHAFLAINLFVFTAATVLSYMAHEEDQELDLLHKRVSKLDRKLDAVDREIHKLNGEAKRIKNQQLTELEEVKAIILELIRIYRGENILAREDRTKPKCFETDPVIQEPMVVIPGAKITPESEVDQLRQMRLRFRNGASIAPVAAAGDASPSA